MRPRNVLCSVLEISDRGLGATGDDSAVRELPPWADPLVARLLAKHRLQAALSDSLSFLQQDDFSRRDSSIRDGQQILSETRKLRESRFPPCGILPANSDS